MPDPASLTILTGASRGLGAAMAEQLLRPGASLLCLSRNLNPALAAIATTHDATLEQWSVDLAEPAAAATRLATWLADHEGADFDSVTLINNAALLTTIAPLEDSDPTEQVRALRVGLEAPLLLTAAFLRATRGWRARREGRCKVLNISSGLGRVAMASQANYCAVKAGLDHLSRSVALDQAHAAHPARIVSLAPGVIDTGMQVLLRSGAPERFPDRDRFVQLQAAGRLDSPATAAAKVLRYLDRSDFGDEPVADVRDA
jgi:benzil reductase ((S)-benzoin forming)